MKKGTRRPVSRVLSPPSHGGWSFIWDARYRTPRATYPGDDAETRWCRPKPNPCRPYSILLPVGFALPPPLPEARCALTAPFHPYPRPEDPEPTGGLLSVALSLGSPPPAVNRHRVSVEPGLSSPRGSHRERRPSGRLAGSGYTIPYKKGTIFNWIIGGMVDNRRDGRQNILQPNRP